MPDNPKPDDRTAFNKRLHKEGRTGDYNRLFEKNKSILKKIGAPLALAWKITSLDFKPLDGDTPHEVALTDKLLGWKKLIDNDPDAPEDADAVWDDVIERVDPSKKANPRERIEWVFQNMGTSPFDIDVDSAPDRGTVAFLKTAKSSESVRDDFYKLFWSKFAPTKAQAEKESMTDDGRNLDALDSYLASLVNGAEGIDSNDS